MVDDPVFIPKDQVSARFGKRADERGYPVYTRPEIVDRDGTWYPVYNFFCEFMGYEMRYRDE